MANVGKLPVPLQEEWEWQFLGACREANPSTFFHPEGERGDQRRKRIARAKSFCDRCEVVEICRERALDAREPFGIWGGMSEDERAEEVSRRVRHSKEAAT